MCIRDSPYTPPFENYGDMQVLNAWDILNGEAKLGQSVLVADWRCDWIGMGIAEQLALNGHQVKLAVNGLHAGQALQSYTRDSMAARLHRLGVQVFPYMRLHGCDDDTVYMQHIVNGDAIEFAGIHSLVPVSYTHLDVYKRQAQRPSRIASCPPGMTPPCPPMGW